MENLKLKISNFIHDAFGAFADGGILFPLLVMLSLQGSFSASKLFFSAGLAYLVSGFIFKIPMAVQPLKAIAIAAIASGASGVEIRISGFLLGLLCLGLTQININSLAKKVPTSIVHCVQLGLGVILFIQGTNLVSLGAPFKVALTFAVFGTICIFSSYSLLGILAVLGLVLGFCFPELLPTIAVKDILPLAQVRVMMILSLVLPQIALTLTNSVVATAHVAKKYYGEEAKRVTERNLLLSIGFGNVVSALWGGLPYCHGSGGMTAHFRGGARTFWSNTIIGIFLMGIGSFSFFTGKPVVIGYPPVLLSSLLMAVGFFHIGLARPTWVSVTGRIQLLASALAAMITRNMLVVLGVAILSELIFSRTYHFKTPREVETL